MRRRDRARGARPRPAAAPRVPPHNSPARRACTTHALCSLAAKYIQILLLVYLLVVLLLSQVELPKPFFQPNIIRIHTLVKSSSGQGRPLYMTSGETSSTSNKDTDVAPSTKPLLPSWGDEINFHYTRETRKKYSILLVDFPQLLSNFIHHKFTTRNCPISGNIRFDNIKFIKFEFDVFWKKY